MAGIKRSTTQKDILTVMDDKGQKTDLWNISHIQTELDIPQKAAENGFYNLWMKGKVIKHKHKDPETGFNQYALSIKNENNRVMYVPLAERTNPDGSPVAKRAYNFKKSKTMPTAKEIRSEFSVLITAFSRLEDRVMQVAERNDELNKIVERFKNM